MLRKIVAGLVLALLASACGAGGTAADLRQVDFTLPPITVPAQPVVPGIRLSPKPVIRVPPALKTLLENPLANRPWGVYRGTADQVWRPYSGSRGGNRALLAKIAERPRATWFGAWTSNGAIESKIRDYVANAQRGNPNALVQMAVFRMVPWEHAACGRLPSRGEQASYRDWINRFARGVGRAHAAIILQPDGPFALCAPGGSRIPSDMVAYAARVLSALPNASVYIDAGAADWPARGQGGVDSALRILIPGGIEHVRGFALNSTHYSPTSDEVVRGSQIVEALAARGITNKHFVVNTSSNGAGFEFSRARGSHEDNADVCRSRGQRVCVTLGIPPTADVGNPRWGLPAEINARATKYVDAYLWFGRPWLHMQADPFVMDRALSMARSTPY